MDDAIFARVILFSHMHAREHFFDHFGLDTRA
jgi:hypothetical protein